jgi:tetratricopeptide (TPR) repeat protein
MRCLSQLSDPEFAPSLWAIGAAYVQKKQFDQAIKAHEHAVAVNPAFKPMLARTYALAGRSAEARQLLATKSSTSKHNTALFVAGAYTALGDTTNARWYVELAYDNHEPWMRWTRIDPALKPLQGHPRYPKIVERLEKGS